jgi:signal peptidase
MTDDSMDGSLGRGSVALAHDVPPSDLRVGDVITFLPPGATDEDARVTHRIVAIDSGMARTKGDAARHSDPWTLALDDPTYARVWVSVPWIGYPFLISGGWVLLLLAAGTALSLSVLTGRSSPQREARPARAKLSVG